MKISYAKNKGREKAYDELKDSNDIYFLYGVLIREKIVDFIDELVDDESELKKLIIKNIHLLRIRKKSLDW